MKSKLLKIMQYITAGWETKICWYSPELGSLLNSLYKIPLAQACFPLARPNFHSHWRAGERQFPSLHWTNLMTSKNTLNTSKTL